MKYAPTILVCFLSLSVSAQLAVSIDAEPLLGYAGNLIGGTSSQPTWQGSSGIPIGIDVGRYREDKDDWIHYRASVSYSIVNDPTTVVKLDDDLQIIPGEYNKDVLRSVTLRAHLGIAREVFIGKGVLKGIWGRGLAIGTSRQFTENRISNPLGAYQNDTLWAESGYSLDAMVFMHAGLIYMPDSKFSVSARFNWV